MNSFILITKEKTKQEAYLKKFIDDHQISPFDQTRIAEEGSIGIEVIRKIQPTLFLKPYKGNAKIVIIDHAQDLTPEAQNALLKILEEPPVYVFIFLCTTTDEALLPTVISRCQVLTLTEEKKAVTQEEQEQLASQLDIISNGTIAQILVLAEQLAAEKETLNTWFEQITMYTREKMLHDPEDMTYPPILLALQEAYKTLQTTNVNPRTILEHTFLSITQ